ncbi:MAG: hypothetical protein K2P81_10760 [Bacteriovoracaceae bacterium]|nr:hypothetical protein [Bacteriovoracaceae bacterium]
MRVFFLLCLFSFSALAQTSYVPLGRILKKGGYEIKGTGRSWASTSRYDVDSTEVPFKTGEGFSYFEGELQGLYGATKELQMGLSANFRQNRSTFENPVGSGTNDSITATGIQAVGGALSYAFAPVGRLNYTLEGFYRYHPYTNTAYDSTDPKKGFVLGDDGTEYGAGLVLTYAHPNQNFLSFNIQYRKPGSELSPEINWQTEGALAWKYLALVAGAQGVMSLNKDAYTDDPQNKPAINTGGSSIYNSINRQYLAPYVGMNIALGQKWRVEGRYQTVTNVRSYDTGSLITLALATRVETNSTVRELDDKFKEYSVDATVVKLSPKKQFIIIDKGLSSDIQVGRRFDLFLFDYLGGNVLLGRAVAIQVNADQSVLKITTRFTTKHEVKEGTIARGLAD